MKSLNIEEVIMPEELVDILMKVHRGEELLGEQVRVLSYWAKGPVPKDEEIRTFYDTLIEKGIKIRTIKEYVLKMSDKEKIIYEEQYAKKAFDISSSNVDSGTID